MFVWISKTVSVDQFPETELKLANFTRPKNFANDVKRLPKARLINSFVIKERHDPGRRNAGIMIGINVVILRKVVRPCRKFYIIIKIQSSFSAGTAVFNELLFLLFLRVGLWQGRITHLSHVKYKVQPRQNKNHHWRTPRERLHWTVFQEHLKWKQTQWIREPWLG